MSDSHYFAGNAGKSYLPFVPINNDAPSIQIQIIFITDKSTGMSTFPPACPSGGGRAQGDG